MERAASDNQCGPSRAFTFVTDTTPSSVGRKQRQQFVAIGERANNLLRKEGGMRLRILSLLQQSRQGDSALAGFC